MPRLDEHHAPAQDTSGLSASTGYLTMTSVLTLPASLDRPGHGSPVTSQPTAAPLSPSRDRSVVPFIALTRSIPETGLMRRSYGYYSAKLIGALLILAAWVVVFILIGDSWWQLAEREYPLTSRLRQRGHGESWMFPHMAMHVSQAGRVRGGRRPCRDRRVASTAWSKQRDFLPTNRFGWTPRRR
jgi:hypothetical protein